MVKFFLLFIFLYQITLSQDDIQAIEKMRYQAMIDGDVPLLNALLHDMLIYSHSNGQIETKEQFINSISEGKLDYRKIETDEVTVIEFHKTIILSGIVRMELVFNNEELKIRSRFSSVYVSDKGWRLVLWQSSRIN